ncbi:hypothetical protein [uncultured Azohydromonas sp.]|uniref:hypothetical protein n=1 Tax=uncultured Azohydromonas sp. TaxID=487342 RepID=UPI0026376F59|nr:hypothetical protein [uncultured Azohydromonas sp.]
MVRTRRSSWPTTWPALALVAGHDAGPVRATGSAQKRAPAGGKAHGPPRPARRRGGAGSRRGAPGQQRQQLEAL